MEYHLNLLSRGNLRRYLWRNSNLPIRREFASEIGGLHILTL